VAVLAYTGDDDMRLGMETMLNKPRRPREQREEATRKDREKVRRVERWQKRVSSL
jgi:hypothetical protein